MNYKDRKLLDGLDTAQMLAVLGDEERQSVLETAAIVRQVLAAMPPPDRPTFSNIAVANLAYLLRIGNFKPLPLLYCEDFMRGLYQHFVQLGDTSVSEPLMDDIMAVAELCSDEELRGIHSGSEAHRCKGPLFDFSVLNTATIAKENAV